MKRSTLIVLGVLLFGGFVIFALTRSTSLPLTSTAAPQSTLASIFTFGTKFIDASEKALPSFFKTPSDDLSTADKAKVDSIFGPGNAFTADEDV